MKRRQWSSQEKLKIVLEGLSGQIEISRLCQKYQIAQTQYYLWRDQLLKYGNQALAFASSNKDHLIKVCVPRRTGIVLSTAKEN